MADVVFLRFSACLLIVYYEQARPQTTMNEIAVALSNSLQTHLPESITLHLLILLLFVSLLVLLLASTLFFIRAQNLKEELKNSRLREQEERENGAQLNEQLHQLQLQEAKIIALLKSERKHAQDKLGLLEEAREELRYQFKSMAAQIFEEKSAKFSELNREKLEATLQPFNNQLVAFKQEINEIYRTDSRERLSLKNEIVHLRELNQQINQEAANLTKALKNDNKTQGNWGELILEKVLENSGLRKGREYETQAGHRSHDNKLFKPDVLIHLPDDKDIIIDAKVSLVNWERYVNAEDSEKSNQYLKQLTRDIRTHLATLGEKNYPALTTLHSLDFVLMFMPVEAAYSAASHHDDTLLRDSLAKNIIIVTPTTLLATLRTIENLWQFEHQSKNSLEIARRAGLMYDKFRGFVEEMTKIGNQITACQNSYEAALGKLTRGRGNLVSQAENLKKLGVQVKKDLPKTIMDTAEIELKN